MQIDKKPDLTETEAEAKSTLAPLMELQTERVFLVVVDNSGEMEVALRFAARRALHTSGRVALAYVVEPHDFGHWLGVNKLMEEEAREEAEQALHRQGAIVSDLTRKMPVLHLRFGNRRDEIIRLIEEEPAISIMILASAANSNSPGPLISDFSGNFLGKLRIPVTIVPGDLTTEQIDAIS